MDKSEVGKILKKCRAEARLTQQEIAEKFGVTIVEVSRWENGHNLPDVEVLLDMSDFYHIDFRSIILGKMEKVEMKSEISENSILMESSKVNAAIKKDDSVNDKSIKKVLMMKTLIEIVQYIPVIAYVLNTYLLLMDYLKSGRWEQLSTVFGFSILIYTVIFISLFYTYRGLVSIWKHHIEMKYGNI